MKKRIGLLLVLGSLFSYEGKAQDSTKLADMTYYRVVGNQLKITANNEAVGNSILNLFADSIVTSTMNQRIVRGIGIVRTYVIYLTKGTEPALKAKFHK